MEKIQKNLKNHVVFFLNNFCFFLKNKFNFCCNNKLIKKCVILDLKTTKHSKKTFNLKKKKFGRQVVFGKFMFYLAF